MELRAELTGRDGARRPFQVSCEPSLPGLLSGLEQLKGEVSAVLSQLVLQEKGENGPGDGEQESAGEDEEEDDDDDEEEEDDGDEDNSRNGTSSKGPPTKRSKTRDS
ncbi:EKC/KEOPS complex subunit GON7 isoform X1 [Spea bombifrons]|uniref:EKC/KEOPS complex subunit GON7 isoform X1 n=1 Tax=Spea bombifrons TaxID=233779 RepID=UPI00234AD041|nr:EKC/KEOPS complex subunit GON7 isoform X1 [Spea bombifrons]